MTTTKTITAEVARNMDAELRGERDLIVRDADVARARDLAVTFGAVETTARPDALLGHYVVTVWME